MPENKQHQHDSRLATYVRLSFGMLTVFGIVGTVIGKREEAIVVFVVTSVAWCLTQIIIDAYAAWQTMFPPEPPLPPPPGLAQDRTTSTEETA